MPFNFNEYLTLAIELGARPEEAAKRSSISRAYYTVFHLANPRAETRVGPWRKRKDPDRIQRHKDLSSHEWCWHQYIHTNDLGCRSIGLIGQRMKWRRVIADYKNADNPGLATDVERQITDAQQFQTDFAALNATFPSPTP
jgi:hypothetical protein